MPTLDTSDPNEFAKGLVAEYTVLADANAGDLTAANTWAQAEVDALDAIHPIDTVRSFTDAVAISLDNFHRTYVYTP